MVHEDMIAKIRKLLAQAEDSSCGIDEAETFSAKAASLMSKYGIEHAMLEASQAPGSRKVMTRSVPLAGMSYASRKFDLVSVVAEVHTCECVMTGSGGSLRAVLIGYDGDLDLTEMLFASLLVQAERALAATPVPAEENTRTFRVEWWIGYTGRLAERLSRISARSQEEATKSNPGTSLVLRSRTAAVQQARADRFPLLSVKRDSFLGGSGEGICQGLAAGDGVHLDDGSSVGSGSSSRCPEPVTATDHFPI